MSTRWMFLSWLYLCLYFHCIIKCKLCNCNLLCLALFFLYGNSISSLVVMVEQLVVYVLVFLCVQTVSFELHDL